jgi:hypothetical protein
VPTSPTGLVLKCERWAAPTLSHELSVQCEGPVCNFLWNRPLSWRATIRMRKTRMKDKLLISSLAVLIALALGSPASRETVLLGKVFNFMILVAWGLFRFTATPSSGPQCQPVEPQPGSDAEGAEKGTLRFQPRGDFV